MVEILFVGLTFNEMEFVVRIVGVVLYSTEKLLNRNI